MTLIHHLLPGIWALSHLSIRYGRVSVRQNSGGLPTELLVTNHSLSSMIAVVDDDQRILESLEILLESADHAVRLFASGAALLESGYLAEIDCLISDIGMSGMNGLELVRAVRAARPGLPIILITGHPDVLNGTLPVGADHYRLFTKPFNGPELLAAVSDAVGAAG
jgi:FixJ family two-component response regulator